VPFEQYVRLCKECLNRDNPEGIDTVFELLNRANHEYRQSYIAKFTGWILNGYFLQVIEKSRQSVIFPEWELVHPDWRDQLKQALFAKKAGSVARAMRQSLILFAEAS